MSSPPGRGKRPSIKDVAARAGVSTKTVSNVLHGHPYLSDNVRERVEAAITELNYRPNPVARNLRGGRLGFIALSVPAISIPYYAELASCIVAAARARGFTVLIDETAGEPERERELLTAIGPRLADGVIHTPVAITGANMEELAEHVDTPIVLLGEAAFGTQLDHVVVDNTSAAREATDHLLGLGRRRIALLGAHQDLAEDERLNGYRAALAAADIEPDPRFVVPIGGARLSEDGAEAMRVLLALPEPPDAVFCYTDLLAYGAMRVLLAADHRIPRDVAVIGFDDLDVSAQITPALSSIAPDKQAIAHAAVDRIVARLSNRNQQPQTTTIPHRLVIRASTATDQ
ncbi:LacI family DNA-binding transcriptional regulator [Jiangella asiatica]|uniref:LacI family transcriptional regulator n=1 Tax=Jiangella asiatica TaxID=2530372 RepID=A0A4R5D8G1_9ACTN|nr:LacI family DNA-binding transcriptional regulator [Jiangella asiatica]TDE08021.1 LacI family transcriptional regulator [Jiangella asiatica]